jgi:hypothetical protein
MKSFSGFVGILAMGFVSILPAVFSCDRANLPPVAQIQIFPTFGDTSLFFEFLAGESEDDRSFKIALQYRWDFEGDGVWDTEFSGNTGIANKYFNRAIMRPQSR